MVTYEETTLSQMQTNKAAVQPNVVYYKRNNPKNKRDSLVTGTLTIFESIFKSRYVGSYVNAIIPRNQRAKKATEHDCLEY